MDSERLEERVSDYLKALAQLEKAGSQPKDEFLRDSVIQRSSLPMNSPGKC